MYGWTLFIYLSTFSARSGMAETSAEFASKAKCEAAAEVIKKEFKTFFTQEPKTVCVEK